MMQFVVERQIPLDQFDTFLPNRSWIPFIYLAILQYGSRLKLTFRVEFVPVPLAKESLLRFHLCVIEEASLDHPKDDPRVVASMDYVHAALQDAIRDMVSFKIKLTQTGANFFAPSYKILLLASFRTGTMLF